MSWIKSLFTGVDHLFTDKNAQKRALAALEKAGEVARVVYPLVSVIAAATPNRTDDEILHVINSYGLFGLVDPDRPDKSAVLREIAVTVAAKGLAKGTAASLISLGVETAVQALKANAESKAK